MSHHSALSAVSEILPRLLFALEIKGIWFRFCLGKLAGQACSPALLGLGEA